VAKKRRLPALIKDMGSCIFKKPFTQQYPFVKPQAPEGYRGKHIFDPQKCISCGLCARDCPAKAIELVEVSGKRMPNFFLDRCIFCYLCAEACPRKAIKLQNRKQEMTYLQQMPPMKIKAPEVTADHCPSPAAEPEAASPTPPPGTNKTS